MHALFEDSTIRDETESSIKTYKRKKRKPESRREELEFPSLDLSSDS